MPQGDVSLWCRSYCATRLGHRSCVRCQCANFHIFVLRESLSFLCRLADLNTHSHTSTLGFVPECCNLRFYEYIQGDFLFG
uniref:Uncharacterized protein n=1 Tax=Anguilla anguilla TaxID=7936 RepID=A0A0E9WF95_ANGAN